MVKNYFLFLAGLLFLIAFNTLKAQESPVLSFSIPSQNNIKFNRFLQNPTYSFVEEENTFISIYHRNQWIQFKDSPRAYLLSYSGRFGENTGMGIGIYQQNLGVITSFGAIGNYAYNIRLLEDVNLTLGFNLAYYNSGVDNNRTITAEDDPLLLGFESTSLMAIKPGLNISYKNLNLGVFAENLVDYNFKTNELDSEYIDRSYSSQLMYTHNFNAGVGLFESTKLRLAVNGQLTESFGIGLGGSVLVDFPSMGWLKVGLDDYYGVGAGFGIHLSKRLSIGYTYERTIKEGLVNLGPTHELNLVFAIGEKRNAGIFKDAFVKRRLKKRLDANTMSITERDGGKGTYRSTTTTYSESDKNIPQDIAYTSTTENEILGRSNRLERERRNRMNRIARLKLELDHENEYLLKLLEREDTVMGGRKSQLEEQIRNLKLYAQRENQVNAIKSDEIETIVLRSANPIENKISMPKTAEDLKHAENGYYLVQKPVDSLTKNDFVSIERFDLLPDAVRSYNVRYANGAKKGLYIIHVDNPEAISSKDTNGTSSENSSSNNPEVAIAKGNTSEITNKSEPKETKKPNKKEKKQPLTNQIPTDEKPTQKTPKTSAEQASKTSNTTGLKTTRKDKKATYDRRKVDISSIEEGYYIITNVFSEKSNAEKFMVSLQNKGLSPKSFINPKNGYNYVYLYLFATWKKALECYYSDVYGKYTKQIWIMDNKKH